ncbi:hypothetical protein Tco_1345275 [Tanacetum coccineum]
MSPMASSDSEVKTCSKTCLKNNETLKRQYDDLRTELNKSQSDLASVKERLLFFKKNEVVFGEKVVVLKRDVSIRDSEINLLRSELEKLKQEKESYQLKIENFENASKSLDQLLGSQIADNSRKGVGFVSYNVVPPPHTGLFSPPKIDLSNSGLEEFQEPKFEGYGPKTSKNVSEESPDASLVEKLVSDDKSEKKTIFLLGNQKNWNNQKSQQLGSDIVMNNKACFVCGSLNTYSIPVNTRDMLMIKNSHGIKAVNTAKPKDAHNAIKRNRFNIVKASACWVWMPKNRVIDHERNNAQIDEDHFGSDGCTDSGEAGNSYMLKDQEDEVFESILSKQKVYFKKLNDLKLKNRSRIRINKWYQSFALRNFDLEDMELESTNNGPNAKLPILKLGEYEMWAIRIKQYFQIQDYALWEVIENGDSWVPVSQTSEENGITVTKMSTPVTAEEKTNKKNDVKARANQENLKTLSLKLHMKNFSAASAESLDSIFNRLQKIVSRLAILGVNIAQEDLNLKFLNSLPPEWNTHVTNNANTASSQVSVANPSVNTASPQVYTASVSDNTMYAFMVENLNGSNVLHQDLEQIHEDDLEAIDLK